MTGANGRLPPETSVGRVALTVNDGTDVAEFYEAVVGLTVHERGGDRTVLGDGETPLLVLVEDSTASARPRPAAGLFHTAFRVPSRAALGAALERVEDVQGLDGAADHRVSEALYLRDPEGNGVEIYRDRPATDWTETADGEVRMTTEPLDIDGVRAAAAGGRTAPVGTDVGHVHLEVTDLSAARAFYADALGMCVRTTADGALFLAAGDYHHHVGTNVWNGRTDPASGRGLAWFELVVSASGLDAATERLTDAGYAVESTSEGATVTDPDGLGLRLRLRS
jgi:catechol 2,3-dioxygenase